MAIVCKYCLQEIPSDATVCPLCGFPVSVPFNVQTVQKKWALDMSNKAWKVQPSFAAMHRAEKMGEDTIMPQQERQPDYNRQAPTPPQMFPEKQEQSPNRGFDASAFDSFFNT